METIKRRALWGWLTGLVLLAGIFAAGSIARPTVPGASAAIVSRVGLLSVAAVIPVVLGGRAISRFTPDNSIAAVALPVFLATVLGVMVVIFGFTPEDARLCNAFARYETIEPDPACFTSTGTRLRLLAEGYALWLAFGAVAYVSFRLRDRRRRRELEAIRA